MDQVPPTTPERFYASMNSGTYSEEERDCVVSWKDPLMITMMLLITVVMMPLQLPLMSKLQYIYNQFDCNMRKITPETDGRTDSRMNESNPWMDPKDKLKSLNCIVSFIFFPTYMQVCPQSELSVWTSGTRLVKRPEITSHHHVGSQIRYLKQSYSYKCSGTCRPTEYRFVFFLLLLF